MIEFPLRSQPRKGRSPQLGRQFAVARQRIGLTQGQVAEKLRGETSFSRAFVSHIEQGKVPNAVLRFHRLAALLGLDARELAELIDIRPLEGARLDLGDRAALAREVRSAAESGEFELAMRLALTIVESGQSEEDPGLTAFGQLLAAVSAKEAGRWEAMRMYAQAAISSGSLGAANEARATLLLGTYFGEHGLYRLAVQIIESLDRDLFEVDPALGAFALHNLAVSYHELGELDRSVESFARARGFLERVQDAEADARTRCELASTLSDMDRHADALRALPRLSSYDPPLPLTVRVHVLWRAGQVHAKRRDVAGARSAFVAALEIADELKHREWALRARLALAELALDEGRLDDYRSEMKLVCYLRREVAPRSDIERAIARLLERESLA